MSDQSNNSPAMSAGENERGNDSQDKTSQNKGNTINKNGKHNKRGQTFRWNTNDISSKFYFEVLKPKIGGVSTLHTDEVFKIPYQVSKDELTNNVMTKLDGGKDLQISILHLKDPFD